MNKIHILDCTLRDGGYCNQWKFGYENICKIIEKLVASNIDIIECGFLTNRMESDRDISKFRRMEDIAQYLPAAPGNSTFCIMINYGEYNVEELPECKETFVKGIRVAFHKKDMPEAILFCQSIKEKGYDVFLQPMVSLNYTDEEFLELIRKTNQLEPYAFYIVDSFGMMKKKNLIRLFYLAENNLSQKIMIGFHSHNNMQMAYSNAQTLIEAQTSRDLIIDSSIYGMGRGAGNLNTELFVEYLNENANTKYKLSPLLNVIDEILNEFYAQRYWGYSLPNYLSATHNIHPNYASYLDDKKTLTLEDMDRLFAMIAKEKRAEYDKAYMEQLYRQYMGGNFTQQAHYEEFKSYLKGKSVLLIAPGKSAAEEHEKIAAYANQSGTVSISINFDYSYFNTDFIFISNLRRFKELPADKRKKCIATSNITADDIYLSVDYNQLTNHIDYVQDNAGLMAIKLLMEMEVKQVFLAGLDGYSHDTEKNYGDKRLSITMKNEVSDAINIGLQKVLLTYAQTLEIRFLTTEKYIGLEKE